MLWERVSFIGRWSFSWRSFIGGSTVYLLHKHNDFRNLCSFLTIVCCTLKSYSCKLTTWISVKEQYWSSKYCPEHSVVKDSRGIDTYQIDYDSSNKIEKH